MIGETVGNYKIVSMLGRGGMGVVYLAEHKLIGHKAAIKVLLAEYSINKTMVARFFNEARAAAMIEHPGLVKVFDFGHYTDGAAYLAMELLTGDTLAGRLRREEGGRFAPDLALAVVRQIAGAVGAAHARGIIHRDLKPDNIFLVADADLPHGVRVKILDFGIAKLADEIEPAHRTQSAQLLGTPVYMSPEQCRGAGFVDHRSDIYSLGCLLYEALCGRPPFTDTAIGDLILAHVTTPPARPSTLVPVRPAIEELALRLLAKKPEERPQSMSEVVNEIDAITGHVQPAAPPPARPSSAEHAVPAVSTTLGGSASQVYPRPETQGRLGWWLTGGAAIVLVVAVSLFRPRPSPHVEPVAAAAVAVPAAAPAPPKPQQVTLRITSTPPGAAVFRVADGLEVGVTPLALTRASADGEAVFVLKHDGYEDGRVSLHADRDGAQDVTLATKPTPAPTTKRHVAPKKPIGNGAIDPFRTGP